ncbi:MAG: polyprenyl synthetase family protein [Bacteroidales bacterium]|jgi:geranylgeranyl diphosphate synthase type II|nr:polyprenyl synthetase family protein [Bacteroidales bacterium]
MHTLEHLQALAVELIESERYLNEPKSLFEPIDYAMRQGGKRLRPLLVLIAADMFDEDVSKARYAAAAVEILHNFTLLHDDIMDNSPLRRGKPTVYKQFGNNQAILSGDAMFALAMQYGLKTESYAANAIANVLSQASIDVCRGQALDMDFEQRDNVTIEAYIEMVRLKTSVLLGCSLKMGAIIARTEQANIAALSDFGEFIGIAFQIKDDMLDCWSKVEDFGKVKGKDIADKKKTFLYLKALETADGDMRNRLLSLYNDDSAEQNEKISRVIEIYERLNIKSIAQNVVEDYTKRAMESLERVSATEESKKNLIIFANKLLIREK